jgi:hypothetical protein
MVCKVEASQGRVREAAEPFLGSTYCVLRREFVELGFGNPRGGLSALLTASCDHVGWFAVICVSFSPLLSSNIKKGEMSCIGTG